MSASPDVFLTTSNLSAAMKQMPNLRFSPAHPRNLPLITVDDTVQYQHFTGIGAAMTDTSASLLHDQLPSATRLAVMADLFSSQGIHLNVLRVPMGASDFTVGGTPYTYDDMPAGQSDPTLSRFSVAHDEPYILPVLRQARRINPALQILANPWSPPTWMKTSSSLGPSDPLGSLLPSAYDLLARYFVKFIQAYAAQGVTVDAITPQNEPVVAKTYPSLRLSEPDQESFILNNLKPAMAAAGLSTEIYGNDDSWNDWQDAGRLAASPAGLELAGMAWHCYFGSPTVMTQLHAADPRLDEIASECSPEIRPTAAGEYLISSLRNWASAVLVWNVALDPQGGPVQPPNPSCRGCTGVVTVNERTHRARFSRKYYQLGQVSEYVQPGAVRIDSPNFVTYGLSQFGTSATSPGLDDVAFLNPDGSKVLVVYNGGPTGSFAVGTRGRYFTYRLAQGAMVTFVWDRPS